MSWIRSTPEGETVWEFVSPFQHPSKFGETPAIPERWDDLIRRIASGEPIREEPDSEAA